MRVRLWVGCLLAASACSRSNSTYNGSANEASADVSVDGATATLTYYEGSDELAGAPTGAGNCSVRSGIVPFFRLRM